MRRPSLSRFADFVAQLQQDVGEAHVDAFHGQGAHLHRGLQSFAQQVDDAQGDVGILPDQLQIRLALKAERSDGRHRHRRGRMCRQQQPGSAKHLAGRDHFQQILLSVAGVLDDLDLARLEPPTTDRPDHLPGK